MRLIPGLAIAIGVLLAAQPAAQAQEAGKKQQASLPAKPGMPEPMPLLIPGTVGHAPLTLTSSAAATYEEYFAQACPLVLTVDAFGWSTHAALSMDGTCPADVSQITQQTMRAALRACESYSNRAPCSIVAVGRKVVWGAPITVAPGRFMPQDDNHVPAVLRRMVMDELDTAAPQAIAGVMGFGQDGRTATFTFQRHGELGECSGSATAGGEDQPASVMLTCTKIGAVSGTLSFKSGERFGTGTASAGQRQFMLTVLPRNDALKNGTALYTPPPPPVIDDGKPMAKPQEGKKS